MIKIIASIGNNGEIGQRGALIWPLKEDLLFFRKMTMGNDLIMGRKTFESLPKILDGRKNIVITRRNTIIKGAEVRSYIRGLITEYRNKDAFVIGGESIYRSFIENAREMYLTEIDDTCIKADTYFPRFDKEKYDREVLDEGKNDEYNVRYKHILYKRR